MNKVAFNAIKGSVNLITGCGSGLGKATLLRFLKEDSGPILCIDRRFKDDFKDSLDLSHEQRSRIVLAKHDTFDEKVESSMSQFVKEFGAFDNVINVAGVALAFLLDKKDTNNTYKLDHANHLLEFNTVGTFNIIRLAGKYMVDDSLRDKGSCKNRCIVNTSCISTSKPTLGQTFYAGSKAAIDSMTLCLAREFSPFNIRCNTINVGYFDTELLRISDKVVSNYISNEVALCPNKLGHPDEFAHLVHKIVENQMINGSCIKLDAAADILV